MWSLRVRDRRRSKKCVCSAVSNVCSKLTEREKSLRRNQCMMNARYSSRRLSAAATHAELLHEAGCPGPFLTARIRPLLLSNQYHAFLGCHCGWMRRSPGSRLRITQALDSTKLHNPTTQPMALNVANLHTNVYLRVN